MTFIGSDFSAVVFYDFLLRISAVISGFLRDFRVLIQSSVFAVIFVFAVSGWGRAGYQRATRSGPLRPSLYGLTLVSAGPTSFWGNVAFAGGAVFGYCDFGKCRFSRILRFLKRAIFEKSALRLYEG